jgi:hypothetical protein
MHQCAGKIWVDIIEHLPIGRQKIALSSSRHDFIQQWKLKQRRLQK